MTAYDTRNDDGGGGDLAARIDSLISAAKRQGYAEALRDVGRTVEKRHSLDSATSEAFADVLAYLSAALDAEGRP